MLLAKSRQLMANARSGSRSGSGLRFVLYLFPSQLLCQRFDNPQRVGPIGQPAVNSTNRGGADLVVLPDQAAAQVRQP